MRIFVTLLIAFALAGCLSQPPQLDVLVSRIEPAQSTMLERRARVDLRIRNFSNRPISATGMSLELDVNGRRLARGVSDRRFAVPALGETTTRVEVGISVLDVVRQLLALEGRESFDYELTGRIHGRGLGARGARFVRRGELGRGQLSAIAGQGSR